MKNRNNPNLAGARMNRGRNDPESIRADQHQADEQLRIGHLWSNSAPAGYIATADGAGGASWAAPAGGGGAFAYTPAYSLYGTYNTAPGGTVNNAIQIGVGASAVDDNSIVIGYGANVQSPNSIVIGVDAYNGGFGQDNIVMGHGADAGYLNSYVIVVGYNAHGQYFQSDNAIIIGKDTLNNSVGGIVIGWNAGSGFAARTMAMGAGAYAGSDYAIAVGAYSDAGQADSMALGAFSDAGGQHSMALGWYAVTGANANAVAIGPYVTTTRPNSVRVGPNNTNVIEIDNSAVAGNTCLLIYDVDNTAVARVSVGADDSGGSGYKLLRIPN